VSPLRYFHVLIEDMAIVIPQADCRLLQVMFVAQNAQGRCGEHEQAGVSRRQPQPARREDTETMAVTEEQGMAVDGPQASDYPVRAGTNRCNRLAAQTAAAEQIPARPLLTNVSGASPLVLTILPLPNLLA
jgi:hypothetical protein